MQEININKRIILVNGDEEPIDGYELKRILGELDFDLLIYWHKQEAWEGSGYAVWRTNGKWAYADLNHCSCNDEFDRMIWSSDKAKFTKTDIKKIIENEINNAYNDTIKLYTGKLLDVFIKETTKRKK